MNRYVVRYRYTKNYEDSSIPCEEYGIIDTDTKENAEKIIMHWGKRIDYTIEILNIEQSIVKVFSVEEAEKNFSEDIIKKIAEGQLYLSTRKQEDSEILENYSKVEFDEKTKKSKGYNGLMGFSYEKVEDFLNPDKIYDYAPIDHYETF